MTKKKHTDINLGAVVYISIIYDVAEYRLHLLNGTFTDGRGYFDVKKKRKVTIQYRKK